MGGLQRACRGALGPPPVCGHGRQQRVRSIVGAAAAVAAPPAQRTVTIGSLTVNISFCGIDGSVLRNAGRDTAALCGYVFLVS